MFDNNPGSGYAQIYIQYWMFGYGPSCPNGWMSYAGTSDTAGGCYMNSKSTSVAAQSAEALAALRLKGTATAGGSDVLQLTTPAKIYVAAVTPPTTSGGDTILNLAQGWQEAEFNIFGDGNAGQANFNIGATAVVRTSVQNGTTDAPSCADGFTAETNDFNIVSACSRVGGAEPAILFTENSYCPSPVRQTNVGCLNLKVGTTPTAQSETFSLNNRQESAVVAANAVLAWYNWSGASVGLFMNPTLTLSQDSSGTALAYELTFDYAWRTSTFPERMYVQLRDADSNYIMRYRNIGDLSFGGCGKKPVNALKGNLGQGIDLAKVAYVDLAFMVPTPIGESCE